MNKKHDNLVKQAEQTSKPKKDITNAEQTSLAPDPKGILQKRTVRLMADKIVKLI